MKNHGTQSSDNGTLFAVILARLIGIEPTHPAPEAGALSTELRAQTYINSIAKKILNSSKKNRKKVLTFDFKFAIITKLSLRVTQKKKGP